MKGKQEVLAVILAGGRVDELNVLTYFRPKSAVPFGGFARVIDFPMSNLMHSGLDRVAVLSQYRNFSLFNHIGTGTAWDMIGRYRGASILPPSTRFSNTNWYRGTADAVFQNLDFIQYHHPEVVLILSGDHVYQMDYREIIEYHREKNADLTMGCLKVDLAEAHRFGVAEIDNEDGSKGGKIIQYSEKPQNPQFNWASMTVFCFRPRVLYEFLELNARDDKSYEFGRDIIPRMMAAQKRVYGYKFRKYWGYTRTIEEYWRTNMDLLSPEPKIDFEAWGIRTNLEHRNIRDYQPLKTGPRSVIKNSMVYNGCVIDGSVENSILFPGVHVKEGAEVRDSVLFFDSTVGEDSRVEKVVADVHVIIGNSAEVGESGPADAKKATVIGWHNRLPDKVRIGSDCTLYPDLAVEKYTTNIESGTVLR